MVRLRPAWVPEYVQFKPSLSSTVRPYLKRKNKRRKEKEKKGKERKKKESHNLAYNSVSVGMVVFPYLRKYE
jgi:hypothetical protein